MPSPIQVTLPPALQKLLEETSLPDAQSSFEIKDTELQVLRAMGFNRLMPLLESLIRLRQFSTLGRLLAISEDQTHLQTAHTLELLSRKIGHIEAAMDPALMEGLLKLAQTLKVDRPSFREALLSGISQAGHLELLQYTMTLLKTIPMDLKDLEIDQNLEEGNHLLKPLTLQLSDNSHPDSPLSGLSLSEDHYGRIAALAAHHGHLHIVDWFFEHIAFEQRSLHAILMGLAYSGLETAFKQRLPLLQSSSDVVFGGGVLRSITQQGHLEMARHFVDFLTATQALPIGSSNKKTASPDNTQALKLHPLNANRFSMEPKASTHDRLEHPLLMTDDQSDPECHLDLKECSNASIKGLIADPERLLLLALQHDQAKWVDLLAPFADPLKRLPVLVPSLSLNHTPVTYINAFEWAAAHGLTESMKALKRQHPQPFALAAGRALSAAIIAALPKSPAGSHPGLQIPKGLDVALLLLESASYAELQQVMSLLKDPNIDASSPSFETFKRELDRCLQQQSKTLSARVHKLRESLSDLLGWPSDIHFSISDPLGLKTKKGQPIH